MHCPNYKNCQLVHLSGFVDSESHRETYIQNYCTGKDARWSDCKRFQIHGILHFCPDFVFPDTRLSLEEIMEKFDNDIL